MNNSINFAFTTSMHKLVIAEKPSVAKEIAHVLGAYENIQNKNGTSCKKGNGYFITNVFGHLYGLGEPTDYGFLDIKRNTAVLNELPIIPKEFSVFATDTSDEYKTRIENQRLLIKELMERSDVDEIICATDAGREGELIFRYIYIANRCSKPVKRLWISSLTEESIKNGFKNLKSDEEYDNLFKAGFARAKADWLFGMNLSRLFSCLDNANHRVGRVKTPVLSIIVKRDNSISDFESNPPSPYYKVILDNGAECEKDFQDSQEAEFIAEKCKNAIAAVSFKEVKEESENRPYLHSLTSLQQESNEINGLTAAETLDAAQSLYEKALITYPRTDSKNISEDMKDTVINVVESLKSFYSNDENGVNRINLLLSNGFNLDKRVINSDGITDHHAIIPTIKVSAMGIKMLSENEKKVLDLVINRFLSAIDEPYIFKKVKYIFKIYSLSDYDYNFILTGKTPVKMGWKQYNLKKEKTVTENITVPDYSQNDDICIANASVKECRKQSPKHYNDSTILSVMENIDNIIESKELKSYVKGKGIGTPATRAGIIDELIKNGYICRKGKNLISTDFGKEFIASLGSHITSVERTAEWEQGLENISNGTKSDEDFLNEIIAFITSIVQAEKASDRKPMKHTNVKTYVKNPLGKCPYCRKNIFEGKDNFYCENDKDKCNFTIWKKDNHGFYFNEITADDVIKLLSGEAVKMIKETKDKKRYNTMCVLEIKEDIKGVYPQFVNVKSEKISLGDCPRCKEKGYQKNIYEGEKNYYCENGKECGFSIYKDNKYPATRITVKNVKDLIKNGVTEFKIKELDSSYTKKYCIYDTGKYINFKEV